MTPSSAKRFALWGAIGVVAGLGLVAAFWPRPVPVDLATAETGPLMVTIDETGETRIRDVFTLSAPVTGRALRIELEAGDPVKADETIIAQLEPVDPAFLDARTETQLRARVSAAEAAKALAEAEIEKATADLHYARAELERARPLVERGALPKRRLDEADSTFRGRKAELARAEAQLRMRDFELEHAKAQLVSTAWHRTAREDCECLPLLAPVDGSILRVLHESEGVVAAGTPLVEIGDPDDLEIVVDLLSQDAVRAEPGQAVIVEGWGGGRDLAGTVERVEPWGFTKVSALGIEEQRVNVVIRFEGDAGGDPRLGHGFQADVRIVLWRADSVLKVPLTALFRTDGGWAVFVVEEGLAVLRTVERGRSDGIEAEITTGLSDGDVVILHPGNRVADGIRVAQR